MPSKRWQASYIGPDLARHTATSTFDTQLDGEAWLALERRMISEGTWVAPAERRRAKAVTTFGEYAAGWLRRRQHAEKPLKPRTLEHYERLLERFILPTFGTRPLTAVTLDDVEDWHDALHEQTGPTYRAHAYALLRTIYRDAERRDKVVKSPCRVKGAGATKRAKKIEPASLEDLTALAAEMPERLRAMVVLMAWCALRFGEAAELRRKDVDLKNGVLKVRRAVVRTNGALVVGETKSDAGRRDIAIPPHVVPLLRDHIATHAAWGRDGLLFPAADGDHLAHSSFLWHFNRARASIGRPDLTPHVLRHTGAVLAAHTGATLAELMARLGHSTPSAAMRYQHAAKGRDAQIAEALSAMVGGGQ
nr:site-specific integrase [Cellulomonas sp. APG4]